MIPIRLKQLSSIFMLGVFLFVTAEITGCSDNPVSSSNDPKTLPFLSSIRGQAKQGPADTGAIFDSITAMLAKCTHLKVAIVWMDKNSYSNGGPVLFDSTMSALEPLGGDVISVETVWPLKFSVKLGALPSKMFSIDRDVIYLMSIVPSGDTSVFDSALFRQLEGLANAKMAMSQCIMIFNDADNDGKCSIPFNMDAISRLKPGFYGDIVSSADSALIKDLLRQYLEPAINPSTGRDWLVAMWTPVHFIPQDNTQHEQRLMFYDQSAAQGLRSYYEKLKDIYSALPDSLNTLTVDLTDLAPGFKIFTRSEQYGANWVGAIVTKRTALSWSNCETADFQIRVIIPANLNSYIDEVVSSNLFALK